jgi:hypothetical protein
MFVLFIFSAYFRAKYGKIKEKYAKSHAAAAVWTTTALFFCPQHHKKAHYFYRSLLK